MPTPQPLPAPEAYRYSEVDTSNLLPGGGPSRPLFTYAHFWTGWRYVELDAKGQPVDPAEHFTGKGTGEWVPSIVKVPTVKGSGGAAHARDVQASVRRIVDKGGIAFLPGDKRLGKWADYLRVYKDAAGVQHFAELHERAVRLPNGGVRFEGSNEADYIAMLRHIRDNAIDPMHELAYDQLRQRQLAEIERLRELSATNGRGGAQLERMERQLAAWDAAWEREQARARAMTRAQSGAGEVEMELQPEPLDIDYTPAEQEARRARPRRQPRVPAAEGT